MIRRPPRSTLFPYPPLSRSLPYKLASKPAIARVLAFRNRVSAGEFDDAIALGRATAATPDVASVRRAESDRRHIRRSRRSSAQRSEEHTSELQSLAYLVCRL